MALTNISLILIIDFQITVIQGEVSLFKTSILEPLIFIIIFRLFPQ